MIGLAHRGFSLNDYNHHLVHTLRQAGYTSTLAGVQHVARNPDRIGYDNILETDGHKVAAVAPAAVHFLENAPEEPFFLAVGFSETHREFVEPGPDEDERYTMPPLPLPDTPETRQDMAAYKATAQILDEGMGAVLDALDANGLSENTLVICTTDHGIAFPGMKCNLTDHGIGIMLIMRGPGGFTGGRVVDAMVSHIDIFPTLCDLLNIDRPDWLQGRSMLPLLRDEAKEINDAIYADVTYHAAYEPKRCLRTRRYKYIRRFDDRDNPVLPNCDDSLSKNVWLRHGWNDRAPAEEQLYDLIFDPVETNNLADDPAMADVLADLRARMDRWLEETDDPVLQGHVPAPEGARVNDPDGLSPREPAQLVK
jgi:arylsulfatase A-like enzyme